MKKHWLSLALASFGLILIFSPVAVSADPQVFEASGATPADIQTAVGAFRNFLGPNRGIGGHFPDGRREINWDGVPDARSAPNLLPANFFNSNSPRGALFFTPGTGFQVSANLVNPTNTPVRFGNIHPVYPALFSVFSEQRLFTALNSTITEQLFFVPDDTTQSATSKGFGAVFTDVNTANSTKIEYFDVNGNLLFSRNVLPGPTNRGSLSFLGVGFDTDSVFMVRIRSGNRILKTPNRDVVVMDDFIYGEPQALHPCPPAATLVATNPTYSCGGTCWGHISGTGLAPNAAVNTFAPGLLGTGFADSNGNFDSDIFLSCGAGWSGLHATSTTATNQPITSNSVDSPCN